MNEISDIHAKYDGMSIKELSNEFRTVRNLHGIPAQHQAVIAYIDHLRNKQIRSGLTDEQSTFWYMLGCCSDSNLSPQNALELAVRMSEIDSVLVDKIGTLKREIKEKLLAVKEKENHEGV